MNRFYWNFFFCFYLCVTLDVLSQVIKYTLLFTRSNDPLFVYWHAFMKPHYIVSFFLGLKLSHFIAQPDAHTQLHWVNMQCWISFYTMIHSLFPFCRGLVIIQWFSILQSVDLLFFPLEKKFVKSLFSILVK